MKEAIRTAAKNAHRTKTASASVATAKTKGKPKEKNPAPARARSSQARSSAAKAKSHTPRRGTRGEEAGVQPIRAAGAKKRSARRRASGLENWVPEGPVRVGGVMKRGSGKGVHFAGVENRSHAAHLNDDHAEPHPKAAVNPLHGPFPARLKQP